MRIVAWAADRAVMLDKHPAKVLRRLCDVRVACTVMYVGRMPAEYVHDSMSEW
jgi:hypothetical protein